MKKLFIFLTVAILLNTLLTGCQSNKDKTNKEETAKQETRQNTENLDYSNQDEWIMTSGEMQSPINITSSDVTPMMDEGRLNLNYNEQISYVEDNENSIQVGASGVAQINGRRFELEQIQFHSISEHTINAESFPLEAHFIHKSQDGRLAVITILFKEGESNEAFQSILNQIKKDDNHEIAFDVDLTEIMPESKNYYHYLGSLTTPPLTENAEWYIFSRQVELSKEQIEKFQEFHHDKNRDLQPLNGRTILFHEQS